MRITVDELHETISDKRNVAGRKTGCSMLVACPVEEPSKRVIDTPTVQRGTLTGKGSHRPLSERHAARTGIYCHSRRGCPGYDIRPEHAGPVLSMRRSRFPHRLKRRAGSTPGPLVKRAALLIDGHALYVLVSAAVPYHCRFAPTT